MKWMKILVLLSSSIVFAVFLCELTLRIIATSNSKHVHTIKELTYNPYKTQDIDRIVDWKTLQASSQCSLPPAFEFNGFITNSKGFMFPELPYEKKKNTFRTVLLGDSFAFTVAPYSHHILPTVTRYLQNYAPEYEFEYINLGIACIGTSVYKKAFQVEGRHYSPNLVLMGFYIGNDFTDNRDNQTIRNLAIQTDNTVLPYLYHSRLFALVHNFFLVRAFMYTSPYGSVASGLQKTNVLGAFTNSSGANYNPFAPKVVPQEYLGTVGYMTDLFKENSPMYDDLPAIEQDILDIQEMVKAEHAELIVFIIPVEAQVNKELLAQAAEYKREEVSLYDIYIPQKKIRDVLDRHNIRYVDLLPELEKSTDPVSYYQPRDTHFNVYGTQKVAQILYQYIIENVQLENK